MISTQKIIAMIILVNIIMAIAIEFSRRDENSNYLQIIDAETNSIETSQEEFESEEGIWGSIKSEASQVYEGTIGNVIKWGKVIVDIFLKGLNPFSIRPSQYNNNLEKLVAYLILIARLIMVVIVMVEIYSYFKNKKAT